SIQPQATPARTPPTRFATRVPQGHPGRLSASASPQRNHAPRTAPPAIVRRWGRGGDMVAETRSLRRGLERVNVLTRMRGFQVGREGSGRRPGGRSIPRRPVSVRDPKRLAGVLGTGGLPLLGPPSCAGPFHVKLPPGGSEVDRPCGRRSVRPRLQPPGSSG